MNFIRFLVISGQGFKASIHSKPETVTGFIQQARVAFRGDCTMSKKESEDAAIALKKERKKRTGHP
jgi:hypothetical protein